MAAKLVLLGFALLSLVRTEFTCPEEGDLLELPLTINDTIQPGLDCTIYVRVSKDSYSTWTISANNLTYRDSISIVAGSTIKSPSGEKTFNLKTAFQKTGIISFQIVSSDKSTMHLELTVELRPLNLTINRIEAAKVSFGSQATIVDFSSLEEGKNYIYRTNNISNQVVLAMLNYPDDSEKDKLTSYFIYEINDATPSFKGSLYQFLSKPYVSQSNSVMIFVGVSQTSPSRLIVNDNDNLKNYNNVIYSYGYNINLSYRNREGVIFSSINDGLVAIIMGMHPKYYEDCYLTGLTFDNSSAHLDVYSGTTPSDATLLSSYNKFNFESALPQQLPGLFKTFVFHGVTSLNFQINVNNTKWTTPKFERTGFLMSHNYPFERSSYTPPFSTNEIRFKEDENGTLYHFTSTEQRGDNKTYLMYTGGPGYLNEKDFAVSAKSLLIKLIMDTPDSTGALVRFKISDPALITTTSTTSTTPSTTSTSSSTSAISSTSSSSRATSGITNGTTEKPAPIDDCTETFFDLTSTNHSRHFSLFQNTSCLYSFLVPPSFVADIHINLRGFGVNESVTITSNYGDVLTLASNGDHSSILAAKNLSVLVVAGVNSTNEVTLNITIKPVNIGVEKVTKLLANESQALIFSQEYFVPGTTYIFTSSSKVRIYASFPQDTKATTNAKAIAVSRAQTEQNVDPSAQAASSILLYDNGVLQGSLYNLLMNSNPFISTNETIFLYNANDHHEASNNSTKFTIMDNVLWNSVIQNNSTYYTSVVPDVDDIVFYEMNGPSVMTLMDNGKQKTFRIISVNFEPNSTQNLTIYAGGFGALENLKSREILTYSGKNGSVDKLFLPQDLPVTTKTFILNDGNASIEIKPETDLVWTISPIKDRQGYLMTPNYMNPDKSFFNTTYHVIFKGDGNISLTFDIKKIFADPSCSLSYSLVDKDDSLVANRSTTLNDTVFVGKNLELFISSGNETSKGALFSFSVYDPFPKSSVLFVSFLLLILTVFLQF